MYQQFALTIAISVLLSAFSALSLSPALCGDAPQAGPRPCEGRSGVFFRGFNQVFERATNGYVGVARLLVRRAIVTILLVGVVIVGVGLLGRTAAGRLHPRGGPGHLRRQRAAPAGRLARADERRAAQGRGDPREDRGHRVLPDDRRLRRRHQHLPAELRVHLRPPQAVGGAARRGAAREGHHGAAAARSSRRSRRRSPFPFNIPTISGFGASAGFNFLLQDRSGTLSVERARARRRATFLAAARERPEFATLFTSFDPTYPQVKVELDREKARTLGVPVNEVFQAMSAAMGGTYVNDFNRFGRLYRVYVQADADYRRKPERHRRRLRPQQDDRHDDPALDARHHQVGAGDGDHHPLQPAALGGDQRLARARRTARGRRWPRSRTSSSRRCPRRWASPTRRCPTRRRSRLPPRRRSSWRSCSSSCCWPRCTRAGGCRGRCCSARRWWRSGAFFGVWLAGYDNNVYVQIGLIMLVGLAAKNAILIVEFAKAKHEEGQSVEDAALESARLRFRPILMTAFAFILGVVPLMLASGAGAAPRTSWARRCSGGCWSPRALGVFLIPGNFAFVEGLGRKGASPRRHRWPNRARRARVPASSTREAPRRSWLGGAAAGRLHGRARLSAARASTVPPDFRGRAPDAPVSADVPGRPRVVAGLPGRGAAVAHPDGPRRELRSPHRRRARPRRPRPGHRSPGRSSSRTSSGNASAPYTYIPATGRRLSSGRRSARWGRSISSGRSISGAACGGPPRRPEPICSPRRTAQRFVIDHPGERRGHRVLPAPRARSGARDLPADAGVAGRTPSGS